MKVLNLYAGIGGNRKLWQDVEVTAVEYDPQIAEAYQELFPQDTVIVADAHQYLLDHFAEYDFIWTSPPCQSHSTMNTALSGWGIYRYPDMALYQEILFLKQFCKTRWLVENVEPYYKPLVHPTTYFDRHFFWSNFPIPILKTSRNFSVTDVPHERLAEFYDIQLPTSIKNRKLQRNVLRNCVDPKVGLHVFNAARKTINQEAIEFHEALLSR
jgi:DNA (cytosine-5)-methyltransferase 1